MTTELISRQEGKRKLPDGWRWIKLGDVLEVKSGNFLPAKAMSISGIYPVYGGNGINGYHDEFLFDEPKIVIGRVGALCGCIHLSHPKSWITDNALYVSKKKVNFDNNFMVRCLRFLDLNKQSNSMAQPLISGKIIYPIEIPLPPLPEQKRIAAILDEQMEAVERSLQVTLAQLEAAKALPAAYLRAVFNSPDAQKWERKRVGDILVAPLKTGISKTSLANSEKYCLTLSSVRNGKLDLTASKPVDVSDSEAKGNWVKPGAFYVVRGNGNRSLVGRGALASAIIPQPILYPDLLIEVNIASEVINPRYLRWIWDSDIVRKDIENKARTAAGIYKINQANLSAVELLVPSFIKQQIIAVTLDEQMAEVERLQKSLKSQLDAINKLPSTLLRRAFNGE